MCEDEDINAAFKYAAMYDDTLMDIFSSMSITFIDCEIGIIEEGEYTTEEDVPQ